MSSIYRQIYIGKRITIEVPRLMSDSEIAAALEAHVAVLRAPKPQADPIEPYTGRLGWPRVGGRRR